MLEKSNKTGRLTDRKKSCNRLGLRFFFSRIFNYPGNGKFSKNLSEISGNSRKFSRAIFSSLIILTFFLVFSISDLIFSILLFVLTNVASVFPFFRQIEEKTLISQAAFRLKKSCEFQKIIIFIKQKRFNLLKSLPMQRHFPGSRHKLSAKREILKPRIFCPDFPEGNTR